MHVTVASSPKALAPTAEPGTVGEAALGLTPVCAFGALVAGLLHRASGRVHDVEPTAA